MTLAWSNAQKVLSFVRLGNTPIYNFRKFIISSNNCNLLHVGKVKWQWQCITKDKIPTQFNTAIFLLLKRLPQVFVMDNRKTTEIWMPCDDLKRLSNDKKFGIMVLNIPIEIVGSPLLIKNLWNEAQVRITVDGGTERWLKWVQNHQSGPNDVLFPDMITGDMDSLPKDVLNYFTTKNESIKVVVTPDQDYTDFDKALTELSTYCLEKNIELDEIFVLADSSGRLDQILSNLNTLFKKSEFKVKIFLVGTSSLTWLLPQGEHVIHIPSCLRENQEWCSLLPVGGPCNVTTKGLKWNLDNGLLSFGGIVSSSNTYDGSPEVYINTDNPLIWSMSIETLLAN